ncbi:stromal cell-derived factor 2-like protein 1 [Phymastichus coffea]|uniref:stromal cell-derived factor 2-like protein 1 n=1 Tax=Phymastichus coffea TaxID=108790 RepID=UPI00273C311A|nr:stromal cell-derived factor 2-like protein 1 [Phymastichus coffea]
MRTILELGILALVVQIGCVTAKGTNFVTYNSVIKLMNIDYNVRLHSHDIKYGTGSGQQSVTAIETKEDGNSYWLVKAPTGKSYTRGKPVQCGDIIRLEHTATKKNLHSHLVSSPLSGKQEVSAYGINSDGDTGDHWMVVCPGDYWEREEPIMLKHIDTEAYLTVTGRKYGSPIVGQHEVVGEYSSNSYSQWQAMEGLFIHPNDFKKQHYEHTEL